MEGLKKVYQTPSTAWLSLPNYCKHIKLAMTNEKGTQHTSEADEPIEHKGKGAVEPHMVNKVPVDMDSIFDEGALEGIRQPLVILVEGDFQSGKSTLAYHYCQKWAKGDLSRFDLVALVHLRHPAVHSAGMAFTLDQLLLIAANDSVEGEDLESVASNIKEGLKFLLILDGWNEAPACFREPPDPKNLTDNSFLGKLLRSVSSNTTILITSRPDSSVDLHNRPNVRRVEILRFTKESIRVYIREALSSISEVPSTIALSSISEVPSTIEDEIEGHLVKYPAIEHHCYVPLNAAIFTYLYLECNRTLPTTHFEMFNQLLLHYIACEVKNRQPKRTLGTISSLDALPRDLKKQLKYISILAYEGLISEKIVFTQDELLFLLPVSSRDTVLNYLSRQTEATQDKQNLPIMGVLQIVQWTEKKHKTISYNFVNHSIQEMLAAYHISQMRNEKQVKVFRTLLSNPRFAVVLLFYASLTKFTNQGVCDYITRSDVTRANTLSYIRCFFEAQIQNQSLYEKLFLKMNAKLYLANVTLSPLVCISIGYFLAFVLRRGRELKIDFERSDITDHKFGLMMKELSEHAEKGTAGALHGVTELNVSDNSIGDPSIDLIADAVSPNTTCTMTKLNISGCKMSDDGAESLVRVLAANTSLQILYIINNDIGDNGIEYFATAFKKNNTLRALTIGGDNTTDKGALSLAEALTENSSMESLGLSWSSEYPDRALEKIGKCISKTALTKLHLEMNMPLPEERAKEWLQRVEEGGEKLILSLDKSNLENLYLVINYHTTRLYFKNHHSHQLAELHKALDKKTANVSTFRREIKQPEFSCLFYSH